MSTINPPYQPPPPDTVEVDCKTLEVSGDIRSPTITTIRQNIGVHVNDLSIHRRRFETTFTTDGVSDAYTITHSLGTSSLQVSLYDVTNTSQQILFVHWEPVSENAIRILPDVRLAAGRTIQILIQ